MAKTFVCNGELIRFYREDLGWTQLQLAMKAGFSERLIRKVEGGHSVRLETLEVLAEALSRAELKLAAADLMTDPLAVAQAFVRGYLKYRAEAGRRCAHLFHPDVVMVIHSENVAFGGEYHGIEGIDRMIRTAYEQFEPLNEDFGRWFTNGTKVAALRNQVLRARHAPEGPELNSWLLHEYTVVGGKIQRIDNYLDSLTFARVLNYQPHPGSAAPEGPDFMPLANRPPFIAKD